MLVYDKFYMINKYVSNTNINFRFSIEESSPVNQRDDSVELVIAEEEEFIEDIGSLGETLTSLTPSV